MKERIVIGRNEDVSEIVKKFPNRSGEHIDFIEIFTPHENCKLEQVPETWEELKELCKSIKGVKLFYDNIALVEYIEINKVIAFNENGLMLAMQNDFNVLAKNRTISQMWQIIKNLIGG